MNSKKAGKEGSKSQKTIYEANQSCLKFYLNIIVATNVVFFVLTTAFFWEKFILRYVVLSVLCVIASLASYKFMSYMSTPTFEQNERGISQLVDAGLDLNIGSGGIAEYAKDLILACCIVQGLSLIHNGFWLLLLFVPGRVCYLFWVHILAPWIFDPNQSPTISEKKQKKQERRMKRMQNAGR
ncbi:hypothetical protein AAHC03_022602 [Spirometra sp. Aus1]|nr:unnamed protein product [Spirometra erinaceieuropaei]